MKVDWWIDEIERLEAQLREAQATIERLEEERDEVSLALARADTTIERQRREVDELVAAAEEVLAVAEPEEREGGDGWLSPLVEALAPFQRGESDE